MICLWISQAWIFSQKWSLSLSWSEGSQTIWMDHELNWFTIQQRTLMNLMIHSSKTYRYLHQTLRQNLKVLLFKDPEHLTSIEHNAVMTFKLLAVLWLEITFMNCCYDNWHCECRFINKNFKLQHLYNIWHVLNRTWVTQASLSAEKWMTTCSHSCLFHIHYWKIGLTLKVAAKFIRSG